MLRERLIEINQLERHFNAVLPRALQVDIDPREFKEYLEEVRRRFTA